MNSRVSPECTGSERNRTTFKTQTYPTQHMLTDALCPVPPVSELSLLTWIPRIWNSWSASTSCVEASLPPWALLGISCNAVWELCLGLLCSQALCLKFPSTPSGNSQTPALPHMDGLHATHSRRQPEQLEEAKFRQFLCPPLRRDGVPLVCTGVTSRGILSSSSHEI